MSNLQHHLFIKVSQKWMWILIDKLKALIKDPKYFRSVCLISNVLTTEHGPIATRYLILYELVYHGFRCYTPLNCHAKFVWLFQNNFPSFYFVCCSARPWHTKLTNSHQPMSGPSVGVCGCSFYGVCHTTTEYVELMSAACWWENSCWFAVQLSKLVHKKTDRGGKENSM